MVFAELFEMRLPSIAYEAVIWIAGSRMRDSFPQAACCREASTCVP
jgi:hypothetical protein